MRSVLIQLIPLVIGNIVMPTWVVLVLAMLVKGRGPLAAIAFVTGITAIRLLQGVIFSVVVSAYELEYKVSSLEVIVSILLIAFGVLLWAIAIWQLFQKNTLQLMTAVGALTPLRALGLGVFVVVTSPRCWIFTLAAIGIIGQAGLETTQSVIAYLLYTLGADVLLITPILLSLRTSVRLDLAAQWLERYNQPIVVVVSLAVGGFFIWRGVTGLLQ